MTALVEGAYCRVYCVGVGGDLAGLVGALPEVARAGHPVEAVGAAVELELLVDAGVALGVGRLHVQVAPVGAVLVNRGGGRAVVAPPLGRDSCTARVCQYV